MQKVRYTTFALWTVVLSCLLTWGCGKDAKIEAREQQAIQLVKAYKTADDSFSVVSNIQKKFDDDGRAGNKWEGTDNWEAGIPSQKDFMMEKLSQYFNVFRPSGDFWVRFSYKDKDGVHEGMWDVNIYSKKVTPKNDVAQQLSKGS